MSTSPDCPLAGVLAERLHDSSTELVARWLARISARVSLDPNRVFPSEELLDHVPVLIEGIAEYIRDPADEITADVPVVAKAIELGRMRHQQGFPAGEIMKEYEILGGILFHFLTQTIDSVEEPCTRAELLACGHRLFRAVAVIQQATMNEYLQILELQVGDREARLRSFNRALSHEMKNRLGVIRGSISMLTEDFVLEDPAKRRRFKDMLEENIDGMEHVIGSLVELTRAQTEARRQRNVLLPEAAWEVVRQLRHLAASRDVELRIAPDLPRVEVPASALELALSNYLSNAIKYSDPRAERRYAEVRAVQRAAPDGGAELVVRVADNGVGVPEPVRGQLFERFFRAEGTRLEEGSGLGLSIVRETMEALGGRAWAEFEGGETVFALGLPCRRLADWGTERATSGAAPAPDALEAR